MPGSKTVTIRITRTSTGQYTDGTFNVSVTACIVDSVYFTTAPNSTLLRLGIDTQPKNIQFALTQSPDCSNTLAFSLVPNTIAFLTVSATSDYTPVVTITSAAAIPDNGTYLLKLRTVYADS